MTSRGNLRHLRGLFREARGATTLRLAWYVAAYLVYRLTGWKAYRGGVFTFRFGRFQIVPGRGNLSIIGEIFVDRIYQVRDFVPSDGETCVDVGANIGCVSLQWRHTNRTGPIIAIEPHPRTVEALRSNCGLNACADITIVHAAVASHDGPVDLILDANQNSMALTAGEHLRYTGRFAAEERTVVPGLTLDSLVSSHGLTRVHLLKIDVEGFEVECLKGGPNALRVTDRVIMEVHSKALRADCIEILKSHGFSYRIVGNLLVARRDSISEE
jgi:FkbM family methyltransferase